MAFYYDNPEFYKSAFVKLVNLLKDHGTITKAEASDYIELMIGDAGPGVPFDSLICQLISVKPNFTVEEQSLLNLLGDALSSDEYSEFMKKLSTGRT